MTATERAPEDYGQTITDRVNRYNDAVRGLGMTPLNDYRRPDPSSDSTSALANALWPVLSWWASGGVTIDECAARIAAELAKDGWRVLREGGDDK